MKGLWFNCWSCQPVATQAQTLCFDRSLLSSLCLLMSTVEPTDEGTTQHKRNKETTRSTTDCLQWAIGEGIGQYLCCTDIQGESQNGKLYHALCAVWLSSVGVFDVAFCHLRSFLENWVTPHQRLEACCGMPKHAAAQQIWGTVGACQ